MRASHLPKFYHSLPLRASPARFGLARRGKKGYTVWKAAQANYRGYGMKPREILKNVYRRYVLSAMSSMGLGLFASLVIGLILSQLSKIPLLHFLAPFGEIVSATSPVVGAAIGVAIAHGLGAKPLAMFASAATGALGYKLGGPVGAYFAAVVGAELGSKIAGKTKVDIIFVPITTIVSGGLVATFTAPGINAAVDALQRFLGMATALQPIPMGIIVSVIFGLALTAPISSAALAAMIFTVADGQVMEEGLLLAAGAATAGCCAHMVGFAAASFRENGVAGLIAQGLGTSMLQMGNIFARPAILLPPVVASAITGPLSTTLFRMKNASAAAGMGTSGLVGQFGTWAAMSSEGAGAVLFKIALLHILLPAALSLLVSEYMRKRGLIRFGDMKLDL